jgi:hypothetical protein
MSRFEIACAFPAVAALALMGGCTTSTDLTDAEKALLVTESDFVEYGLEAEETPTGSFTKTHDWLNRSDEYSYETPDAAGYYVYNVVSVESTSSNAAVSNVSNKAGLKIGFMSAGVTQKPIDLKRPIGSQSVLTLLMKDDKPIGNTFTAIVGKTSVLLIYSGIYFETEDEFREFIDDKLGRYGPGVATR